METAIRINKDGEELLHTDSVVRYSTKEKTREGTTTLTQSPREERRKKQPETATNKNKNTINTEY
jgi:hypothetical protein